MSPGDSCCVLPGAKRFSPAGLQHRMTAELSYLSALEESVRQLSDVERVRGISLAQQESVSLAQVIKVFLRIDSWGRQSSRILLTVLQGLQWPGATWKFIQVSHICGKGPTTWTVVLGRAAWKGNSQDSGWRGHSGWLCCTQPLTL